MSFHSLGQTFIEFAGPDDAMAETYYLAWQSVTPGANVMGVDPRDDTSADEYEMLSAGRYVDHVTRKDGAWRIQKRVTVVDSSMVVPMPASGPIRFPINWEPSRRDGDDASLRLRRRLGIH